MVVYPGHRLNRFDIARSGEAMFWFEHSLPMLHHRVSIERGPVMEGNTVPELYGPDDPVLRRFCRQSELWNGFTFFVHVEESFLDRRNDAAVAELQVSRLEPIETAEIKINPHSQNAT